MAVSTGMGAFQQYQDAAYQQAQRNIAPQQEAQQRKFEQQMLNKGLQPGSKAYNLAQAQMQRGQNDQNNAANFQAMQFGQQAQAQEFGQDFQNRSLAQAHDQFGRSLNEQGRQFDVGQSNQMDQFGRSLSQRESEFGRNFGLQENQQNFMQDFQNRGFAEQQAQNSFGNLMGLGNMALQFGQFANQGTMSDYNMAQGQLGSAPDSGVYGIDTQGAYNAGMTGANNVYGHQMSAYNNMISAAGNVAGAFAMPSALEFKIMHGKTPATKRNEVAARMLTMPIYNWDYKPQYREDGDVERFGVLADDFNRHMIGDEEVQTIDVQRYIAALHLTQQELFYEMRRLENLLWHVANDRGIPLDATPHAGRKSGTGEVFDSAEFIERYGERDWVQPEDK